MANEMMDLQELATYLQRDLREVSKLASRGHLPGQKVAGEWRFARAEINHWLETQLPGYTEQQLTAIEARHAPGNDKIGLDRCSHLQAVALQGRGLDVRDCQGEILAVRAVKTPQEIKCLEISMTGAEAAVAAVRDAIKPGIEKLRAAGIPVMIFDRQITSTPSDFTSVAGTVAMGHIAGDEAIRRRWTVTVDDRPAIIGLSGLPSNAMRTGTRWVTLTQLPFAFCAGRMANSLPVPAPTLWM